MYRGNFRFTVLHYRKEGSLNEISDGRDGQTLVAFYDAFVSMAVLTL